MKIKMSLLRAAAFVLVISLLLPLVVSCKKEEEDEPSQETESLGEQVIFAQNQASDYTIVYSSSDIVGKSIATELGALLYARYGISFTTRSDTSDYEKEIVIGQASREYVATVTEQLSDADDFFVGVADGAPEDVIAGLRYNFEGECTEVGMYLAMARVAHREGYPEIGLYWEKAAWEEAEHASKFAELLGEMVTDSTKKNLMLRIDAENGATNGKFELAKMAKEYNLDAIHDTVHEMARDEARHGKAFEGLLKRYFND